MRGICDPLGAEQIEAFFEFSRTRLPLPLSGADRAAGYWWELSMRQIEIATTVAFDAPRHARAFVEALIADNLGVGRPDTVCSAPPTSPPAPHELRTALATIDRHVHGYIDHA